MYSFIYLRGRVIEGENGKEGGREIGGKERSSVLSSHMAKKARARMGQTKEPGARNSSQASHIGGSLGGIGTYTFSHRFISHISRSCIGSLSVFNQGFYTGY